MTSPGRRQQGQTDGRFIAEIGDQVQRKMLVERETPSAMTCVCHGLLPCDRARFYLHCDPVSSHYLKLVLDATFVASGGDYKKEIVWLRTNAHNIAAKYFARVQDTIFYYTKSDQYTWNPLFT